jgi:hypothetical protein
MRNIAGEMRVTSQRSIPMADKHPSGNPELIDQHKKVQNKGDQELAGTDDKAPKRKHTHDNNERVEADSQNSGSAPGGNASSPGP